MKKYLFGAAIMALAASCAETELDSISNQQAKLDGLTFKAELNEPETRAEWTKEGADWKMFWYAERDQMGIYFKNATVGEADKALKERTNKANWDATQAKATYKASRTLGEGYFVATDNNNIIDFTWNKNAKPKATYFKPSFRYVWPANTVVTLDGQQLVATAPALNTQKQTELSGSSTIQYAMMSGKLDNVEVENENGSASDMLIGLKLQRNFPLAVYSVKNYEARKDLYGNLKSITLSSEGQRKADGKIDKDKKDVLDYGTDAKWNLETNKFTVGTATKPYEVKLTIGDNGLEWKDGATAFMTTNIVDRSENKVASVMKIVYVFDNVQFVDEFDTKNSMLSHQVVRMSGTKANPDFDLTSQPYALIKNGAEDEYTLMINPSFTGKVAAILNGTDVLDKYDNIADLDIVEISKVTKLIVSPDVEDPTTFAKFTALTEVELENEAKLEKGMFNAAGLVSLTANKVTSVDLLFNANTAGAHQPAYTTLVMPSYAFAESKDINLNFFNSNTQSSLVTLNIAGVQDMAVPFEDITLAFVGYNALKNVTVKDGVNVSQNAFKGCTALDNFTGKVNLTTFDATNAFNGATALKAIEIVGTKVPSGAFNGCTALETVKFDGLNSIGASAFAGCTALEYMDLAGVTTLGESAFDGSALTAPKEGAKVLTVGATKVPAYAFRNTNVSLVRFTAATEISHGLLNGCNNLSQVRFDKAFDYTVNSKFGAQAFGTAANVTLYVDKANQKYVDGSKLKVAMTWDEGAVTAWTEIDFKGIYDNAYWKE